MKVCLVETHYHSEYLNTQLQYFKNPTVYTTQKVYDDLPEKSRMLGDFHIRSVNDSMKEFISYIPFEEFEKVYVNTIQPTMLDLPKWKNFKPKKGYLTLHNLNAWYLKGFYPQLNLLHSLDSFASSFYCKKILRNFGTLQAVYDPMLSTLYDYFGHTHSLKIFPFSFAIEDIPVIRNEKVSFVIPGTVSHKRRNYAPVINAFTRLAKEFENFQLVFLGKNEEGLEFPVRDCSEDIFLTFDDTVPRKIYDSFLFNSDFVIVPSPQYSRTVGSAKEVYGITKSPNIHEAIKWRKPTIIPSYIPCSPGLESSTISYSLSEDLYQILKTLLENTNLIFEMKEKAFENTKKYTSANFNK